jgi:thioredoxin-dependent peroxiredoxin
MPKGIQLQLKEGDMAPAFSASAQGGRAVSLDQFRGQPVVLYFYPKDNTPGCTVEACEFQKQHETLTSKGAVVLGVSADSVASHEKFAARFNLPFLLLADTDKKIAEDYGAWGPKVFMGRKFMGMRRVTFLIGPDGRIKKVWPQVKPAEHAREVLEAIKAL